MKVLQVDGFREALLVDGAGDSDHDFRRQGAESEHAVIASEHGFVGGPFCPSRGGYYSLGLCGAGSARGAATIGGGFLMPFGFG